MVLDRPASAIVPLGAKLNNRFVQLPGNLRVKLKDKRHDRSTGGSRR